MSYRNERPRGLMVEKLNTVKLTAIVQQIANLQYGELDVKPKVWEDLVIGFDPNKEEWRKGNAVLICSEGVGWTPNEYGLLPIPTKAGFGNESMTYVSAEVVVGCLNGIQVDLADHIDDRHKDRLETNFAIWHNLLTKEKVSA